MTEDQTQDDMAFSSSLKNIIKSFLAPHVGKQLTPEINSEIAELIHESLIQFINEQIK